MRLVRNLAKIPRKSRTPSVKGSVESYPQFMTAAWIMHRRLHELLNLTALRRMRRFNAPDYTTKGPHAFFSKSSGRGGLRGRMAEPESSQSTSERRTGTSFGDTGGDYPEVPTATLEEIVVGLQGFGCQPYEEIDRGNVMVTLGDFMKLKPPSFSGAKSTEDPQVFLDEMDKICTALGCSSRQVVELTSFRLTEASGMTVSDYDIQFTQLSRYASYMVQTERERIKRFIKRLHRPIYRILVSRRFTSYPEVVDAARKIEAGCTEVGVERERSKRNQGEGSFRYKDPSRSKDVNIVDYQVKRLRSKGIVLVKVIWQNHSVEEAT
ncbi:Uncharacterized protein TCM_045371 [Theobroma cacao]|uniref:Retrotransposon gag domain-containing protein n=1 Tax=Theobroma cacao TaxID=3641 RepID=A0A061FSQ8_THECC|nr:Uncharacterized protein TCM_045371 [Theobroma cacao]